MDKRLSTGRLITDRLILKSLKGAAAAVAVWGGLGYACHFIAERSRAEESAIEAKIAVARRVLADTVGEPSAGGGTNCQQLRRVLDGAKSIVAEVNSFSENAIAEKCSEAENQFKRITPGAKNEASTMLGRLRQLKMDYASARGDFNRRFAVVVSKANDAIQKRASLDQKLNQYRIGLKGVIEKSERESSRGNSKRLLDSLEFMNVHGMKPSTVIAKACSEVEDSWTALSDTDKVVADMIGQVETAKRDIRSKVDELKTLVSSAANLHARFMQLPAVEKWVHSAEWYRTQCRSIDSSVRRYMRGPYFYDKNLADDLLDKVSELQEKTTEEDAPEPVELYRNLQTKYNEFTGRCTWRQGVKHPEVAHVVSSSTPNQWIAESGWEFVHPGTSDLSVRVKWPHPQEWYRNECRVIGDNVRHFTNGPYYYDRSTSNWILNKISELEGKIDSGDVIESVELHKRIQETYRDFAAKCTWRQGVAHPKIDHVFSSSTPNQWIPESGWEFVYPGTSNLTVQRKPPTWARPKEWYERECSVLEKNVRFYTSGGYQYPRGGDASVVGQIQKLRQRLIADDPEGSARAHSELKAAYDTFVNQCQWTSGLRHPRFPHVVSGMTANQWVAENGWEFVNPGTSDFSVRRKPVQVRCDACRGNGYVLQKTRCYSCNGRGRVPNPAAQVGQAVNVVGGIFGALGGRGGRRGPVPRVPQAPAEIRCPSCNGTGNQQQNVRCNKCMGNGMIYKTQR